MSPELDGILKRVLELIKSTHIYKMGNHRWSA